MLLHSDTIVVRKVKNTLRIDKQDLRMELPEKGIFIGIKAFDENQAYSDSPHLAVSNKSIVPRMYYNWDGNWREYDLSSLIAPYFPVLMIGLKVKPI